MTSFHSIWADMATFEAMPYSEYLRTDYWRKLRVRVLVRARGRCERCQKRDRLFVHHHKYRTRGTELMEDLKALCQSCHEQLHIKHPRIRLRVGDLVTHRTRRGYQDRTGVIISIRFSPRNEIARVRWTRHNVKNHPIFALIKSTAQEVHPEQGTMTTS